MILVSIGARYRSNDFTQSEASELCFTFNPLMGHLSTTFCVRSNDLLMATEYDLNIHSYDSDLSVGFIYAPIEKHQLVKVRAGLQRVRGVLSLNYINSRESVLFGSHLWGIW